MFAYILFLRIWDFSFMQFILGICLNLTSFPFIHFDISHFCLIISVYKTWHNIPHNKSERQKLHTILNCKFVGIYTESNKFTERHKENKINNHYFINFLNVTITCQNSLIFLCLVIKSITGTQFLKCSFQTEAVRCNNQY